MGTIGTDRSHCFTLPANGTRRRELITEWYVCVGFDAAHVPEDKRPPFQQFKALWDTGATCCVISEQVVDACGLKPSGMEVVHGVHGTAQAETFLINIGLPNEIAFANRTVIKGACGGADVIIGMDIITMGDFAVTNMNNQTLFSFRYPSQHTVDFVKELNRLKATKHLGRLPVNPAARKGKR